MLNNYVTFGFWKKIGHEKLVKILRRRTLQAQIYSWLPRMCRSHCLTFSLLLWARLYLFLFPFWISEQNIESGNTDCSSTCGQGLQTILTNISPNGKQCLLIEEIKRCEGDCIFQALFIVAIVGFIIFTSVAVIMFQR